MSVSKDKEDRGEEVLREYFAKFITPYLMRPRVRTKRNRSIFVSNHNKAISLCLSGTNLWKDYIEKRSVQSFTLCNSPPPVSQKEDFKDFVILNAFTEPSVSTEDDNSIKSNEFLSSGLVDKS